MQIHDALLALTGLASELLGTVSGFGSSTFFVPVARLLESMSLVLALTAILHCFGNLAKLWVFRGNLRRDLLIRLGAPSVALSAVGALLSSRFDVDGLSRFLGGVLVLVAVLKLALGRREPRLPMPAGAALCGVSGLFTGLVGTGGALRGVALGGLALSSYEFVALSSAIDFGGDLLRAAIYLRQGYMDWSQWFYVPLLGVSALAGARLGRRLLARIDQNRFQKIVACFVLISGISLLLS